MGAVTAIMYGDQDPSVAGMVLDSPFSSLKMLVEELVKDKVSLPNFILNQALNLVKSTVQKKAKFKLEDIEPIVYAKRCFIPAMFVAAKDDTLVKPHHAKMLHDDYPGDKNIVNIEGDHNSTRPRFFKDSAAIFFYNTLQVQFIKEISDNYAGFISNIKKDEDEGKSNEKNSDDKDYNQQIKEEIFSNYNDEKKIDLLGVETIESYNIIEDEEEVFRKILELSKKEFDLGESKKEEVKHISTNTNLNSFINENEIKSEQKEENPKKEK